MISARGLARWISVGACAGMVSVAFATLWAPPRRALTIDDHRALLALHPRLVAVRIVALVPGRPAGLGSGQLWLGSRFRLETVATLAGDPMPAVFEVSTDNYAGVRPRPEEARALVGRLAIVGVRRPGSIWQLRSDPYLRENGGLLVVRDTLDPAFAAMRLAVARTRLDSLAVRAEVVCVGRSSYPPSVVLVRDWFAGRAARETLVVLDPIWRNWDGADVLYFLGRGPTGALEPLGMGAGTFPIRAGVVERLELPLDAVGRLVRLRRFVHDARAR